MEASKIIEQLKMQMKFFLDGKISRKDYGAISEECISEYGAVIQNTEFYKIFMETVPDLCLFYIDEPGDERQKEEEFREGMKEVYDQLMNL